MGILNLVTAIGDQVTQEIAGSSRLEKALESLMASGFALGKRVLIAIAIFVIGRIMIRWINKLLKKVLEKRNVELSIRSFLSSMVNIVLTILLIVMVVSALGVETTSFAALLASAGVAVGMALSGNLQNFAGGLVILLFKPYKVGDVIEAQGETGIVHEIQIFHTIMHTFDNKVIFVPNGSLSNGVVTNYSYQNTRRLDFVIGIEYGEDFERAKKVLQDLVDADSRILRDPLPQIELTSLSSSSVDVLVRVWVKSEDYWAVNFDTNKKVYARFNAEGIGFPFPQLTVHQAAN